MEVHKVNTVPAQAAEALEDEQNAVKTFDTKAYHLPIKPNRHHRKGEIPTWFAVIILILSLAALAGYVYVTPALRDLLPF
jgi:hypothetical protein